MGEQDREKELHRVLVVPSCGVGIRSGSQVRKIIVSGPALGLRGSFSVLGTGGRHAGQPHSRTAAFTQLLLPSSKWDAALRGLGKVSS